jgi:hypothetical protein
MDDNPRAGERGYVLKSEFTSHLTAALEALTGQPYSWRRVSSVSAHDRLSCKRGVCQLMKSDF